MGGRLAPGTNMGRAVTELLGLLRARKGAYKNEGAAYYQPMLVLMTDGKPTMPTPDAAAAAVKAATDAAGEVRAQEAGNKLVVLPVAIGEQADLRTLSLFSAKRAPARVRDGGFGEFF